MDSVKVSVTMSDGEVYLLTIMLRGRFPTLPPGWSPLPDGYAVRNDTDANIQAEIDRSALCWAFRGVAPVSWRRVGASEAAVFDTHRPYRNALRDGGAGKIAHDMPAARELHRNILRSGRDAKMAALDGEWMKATGQNKKAVADAVESQRQALRDLPADPRINAAQTIEELKAIAVP